MLLGNDPREKKKIPGGLFLLLHQQFWCLKVPKLPKSSCPVLCSYDVRSIGRHQSNRAKVWSGGVNEWYQRAPDRQKKHSNALEKKLQLTEYSQAWHHCVGKLLHVFPYLSLTSVVSGVFVRTHQRSHPNAAEKCPRFHVLPPTPSGVRRYAMVSQNWKTWRKPERDWGSTGRKRNTPLDLKRK